MPTVERREEGPGQAQCEDIRGLRRGEERRGVRTAGRCGRCLMMTDHHVLCPVTVWSSVSPLHTSHHHWLAGCQPRSNHRPATLIFFKIIETFCFLFLSISVLMPSKIY